MKNLILRLRLARAFFALVRDPTKTENVFFLSDKSRALPSKLLEPTLRYIGKQPGFQKLYNEKYDPLICSLEELLGYPAGTLGHALGCHLRANNLTIEFFPVAEGNNVIDYTLRRVRRTHDVWHVLTGFDVSVAGEVGLQAFTFAQLRSPFSALLIAGSILHALDRGQSAFFEIMEKIFAGHSAGLDSSPLLGVRWEEKFGENLEQLRAEYGLVHVRSKSVKAAKEPA